MREGRLLLGLIGYPIGHSAAPAMMEAAAEAAGLRAHYQLIEVAGADGGELARLLDGVRRLGFAGVNITFPYKEAVVPLLDALAPGAAALAAVNLVKVEADGRLTGHNTDATGFLWAIGQGLADAVRAGPALLLGAGGAGRAIGWSLVQAGVPELRIFDADARRAAALAALLPRARALSDAAEGLRGAAGLINATPIGMKPDTGCPLEPGLLHGGLWVADAVYAPLITPLLAAARGAGARIMTGRAMSVGQAVDGFAIFSGRAAEPAVIGTAFDAHLAARACGTA
ncbi:MAG: shikimate dehydrogenase [Alphaproteobacteria bacterium]|nr:shikimate dehydrogenase [Alphaproteobacteria bacterium]